MCSGPVEAERIESVLPLWKKHFFFSPKGVVSKLTLSQEIVRESKENFELSPRIMHTAHAQNTSCFSGNSQISEIFIGGFQSRFHNPYFWETVDLMHRILNANARSCIKIVFETCQNTHFSPCDMKMDCGSLARWRTVVGVRRRLFWKTPQ